MRTPLTVKPTEPQTGGLEQHGSSSSAPPTPQRFISIENGQQEVQPDIQLGRTWRKLPANLSQRDRLQRPYGNHQRLESHQEVQIPGETNRSAANSHHSSQSQEGSRRIQGYKAKNKTIFSHRKRDSDAMIQKLFDLVKEVHKNQNDSLWLQRSQYAEQTQNLFAELEASHERMKKLTASMDKIVKALEEGHAQLRKASEKTNKRLNLVFGEQHHSKRDKDCLDQDINKLFNIYHNLKPQPQVHVMDNPYQQDDIKPESMLMNKARSLSQYQDGDNMSYSEKEGLKQLPEASSWPKFSGTGEYDHMELIDYIDGLFIDLPSIPDYWITARLDTEFKGHSSIWYTEIKDIHGRRNWAWWRSQIIQIQAMVLGYGKGPCHLSMKNTLWTKIHMSGVLESLKDLKPLIPR
ncbi:hypothetical protein O181_016042 [Austropuccinia psidii MF-1]|uniref:Uncharacterized protein n=1 Tax=Austropuccinia psidii MF-1 TaxID=1389203 RepID=A0A9Q3C4U0_9BASI|nr:hypothetical protein [Austropuccinia psidii MF-1]